MDSICTSTELHFSSNYSSNVRLLQGLRICNSPLHDRHTEPIQEPYRRCSQGQQARRLRALQSLFDEWVVMKLVAGL
jgi:hypothetical protein